jgi:hypothetical protein
LGKWEKKKMKRSIQCYIHKFVLFIPFFFNPLALFSQSQFSPIPLSLLPDKKYDSPLSFSIQGKSEHSTSIKDILSEYNFIEKKNGEYTLELSNTSFKMIRTKKNILLSSFDYSKSSLKSFADLVDAEAGYSRLISLKNSGNNDYKINELFSKAELGKEGAHVGESIELEFVYRSKTKKQGYLSIYLFTTDGMIAQIFPNKYDSDNLLNPNDNYKFPTQSASKPYKLEAAPPVGNDRIVLIISQKSLSFQNSNTKKYGHLTVLLQNKDEEIKRITEELKSMESYGLYEMILDIKE